MSRGSATGRHLLAGLAGMAMAYLAATAVLVSVSVAALAVGWRPHLVVSGSMGPSLAPGDLVLVAPASPGRYYGTGDVITFRQSAGTVTHRVVDTRVVVGGASYATKGDANRVLDARRIEHTDVVGVAQRMVPLIGRPVLWLRRQEWVPLVIWLASIVAALWVREADRLAGRSSAPARRPAVA